MNDTHFKEKYSKNIVSTFLDDDRVSTTQHLCNSTTHTSHNYCAAPCK